MGYTTNRSTSQIGMHIILAFSSLEDRKRGFFELGDFLFNSGVLYSVPPF